ncbi:MAG: hypothetical protein PUP90_13805 [Nostoc sp. S4]|nr:hypothetical protein [Nostoc sp. S4]
MDVKALEPEELGYYQEFEKIWYSTVENSLLLIESNSLVDLNKEVNQTEKVEEHKENLQEAFANLKEISNQNLSLLTPVLPPSSMEGFHSKWLELLQSVKTAQSPQDIVLQSKTFLTEYKKFDEEFGDRPKQFSEDDGTIVEFKPLFTSAQVGVNIQTWEFTLEYHPSITTPIGEFSVAKPPKKSAGITKLVVVHGDKIRYVTLAPGFEVFVPAKCGVKIKEAEAPRLVVEVPECGSQSKTAEAEPDSISAKDPSSFPESSFPRASCGDLPPTAPSAYPLNFYPVFINFSESNLTEVQNNFCRDAYALTRESTGQKAIQVASFDSLIKAEEFRALMQNKFGSGEIGSLTTISEPGVAQ